MHEAAIVDALIRQVLAEAEAHSLARVTTIQLRVGRLQHLDHRVLAELFALMKGGFPGLAGARLRVAYAPVRVACRSCASESELSQPDFACPRCGGAFEVLSGGELILEHLTGTVRGGRGGTRRGRTSGEARRAKEER
jgi:hydrogenase nickel insertion protein HypA